MSSAIIGIERDVIIEELLASGSDLIIQLHPLKNIVIKKSMYRVLKQGILFVPHSVLAAGTADPGEIVKLCFFYRGRGIFFQTESKQVKNGYAFVIPKILYKQPEDEEKNGKGIRAKVFCSGNVKKGQTVDGVEDPFYPLFKNNLWCYFPEKEVEACSGDLFSVADLVKGNLPEDVQKMLQYHHKILYLPEGKLPEKNYFSFDASLTENDVKIYRTIASLPLKTPLESLPFGAYIPLSETPELPAHSIFAIDSRVPVTPLEINDSVAMLPVCRYLESHIPEVPKDIQGRVVPMKILFINEIQIIFGTNEKDLLLKMGMEYPMSIFLPLKVGVREVFVTATVVRLYSGKKGEACAVLRYNVIREEDRRFLYERYYGTRFL
ncbi:MAG: hypothetical protein K5930_10035 [Treponemataceae bacterium]|nr:hypothetical protein [Treponemataceae bacterium]